MGIGNAVSWFVATNKLKGPLCYFLIFLNAVNDDQALIWELVYCLTNDCFPVCMGATQIDRELGCEGFCHLSPFANFGILWFVRSIGRRGRPRYFSKIVRGGK